MARKGGAGVKLVSPKVGLISRIISESTRSLEELKKNTPNPESTC